MLVEGCELIIAGWQSSVPGCGSASGRLFTAAERGRMVAEDEVGRSELPLRALDGGRRIAILSDLLRKKRLRNYRGFVPR